jgi:hypothetical protein
MKRFYTSCLLIGAFCLTYQSAQASLVFSEPFDYTVGSGLSDQVNSGNSWVSGANSTALSMVSGDLTYPGLAPLGSGNSSLAIVNGSSSSTYITFPDQTSGQVFYSFLFYSYGANSANNYFIALNPSDSAKPAPNGSTDGIDAYYYASGLMEVRANAKSALSSGVTLNLNQTYLIVEMLDLDNQTASIWVNPGSLGAASAPTADATITGTSSIVPTTGTPMHIDDVGVKAQSAAGGPFQVDSIRVGTTWADVTPTSIIPEPATLAFAALGLLGGFMLRFRRR